MTRRVALAIVAITATLRAQAPAPGALPNDIDAQVAAALRAFETPGAAVAVVRDGRVLLARGYGVRRLGERTAVDSATLFQIASNTKAFTTAALGMLVDEGRVGWDDAVTTHLPWFQLSDPYVTREITVRDLLTHRSGLGLGAGDLLWYHSDYPADTVLRRIRYARVASSFRSRYAYDNVLYAVAGAVIPAATGSGWQAFVERRIFAPAGMTGARATRTPLPAGANFAASHARVDGRVQVVPTYTGINTAPAGAIMAGAADLARWMVVQLDSGRLRDRPGARLWSQARTREMWAGETVLPIGESPGALAALAPSFSLYGLGWMLRDYRGHKLVTHSGAIDGMTSRTLLVPDRKLGVVVLTNAESSLSTALAFQIADALLGAPRTDWVASLAAADRAERAAADSVERAARARRTSGAPPSLPLAGYAGRYTDRMYGDATVTAEGGRLVLRFVHSPALTGDLVPWQHDSFVARWRRRNVPDAYVTFALTAAGAVESMKMAAVSPLADFSYDFQDLLFVPAAGAR